MSLRIGITCYPTFGGSGILATEVGQALAAKGHLVHFICTDLPARLRNGIHDVKVHRVEARDYPVFPTIPYSLALTSKMVEVARTEGLDVLHAHYAVPHAVSAWMAREILGPDGPKVVTTLHGTDITLVGSDPSYLPITRHSILRSDAVTAPSRFLAEATWTNFDLDPAEVPIEVVPNFVDPDCFFPRVGAERPALSALFGPEAASEPVLVHTSNFRPLKRVDRVLQVFDQVNWAVPCRLVLMGDGPERAAITAEVTRLGLDERVCFLPQPSALEAVLRECDLFLLPSETESFGLAALEALSSGVPVIASAVGGLPEVVDHERTGFLCEADDVEAMAAAALLLLLDPERRQTMARAARADVLERFRPGPRVSAYEAVYARVLGR